MKWFNAQRDEVPADKQQVLVSVNGIYYITIYDARERKFRLRDDKESFFSADEYLIYWTEFSDVL